jgi:BolA-like protein 1
MKGNCVLPNELKSRIEQGLNATYVHVNEFSGGTDHYSVIVVSNAFAGVSLLKRHRLVMDLFKAEMKTEEVHALTIRAYTADQWEIERLKPSFLG